jgi:hypothetical protein
MVSPRVAEDGNPAVRLGPRLTDYIATGITEPSQRVAEVLDAQEEPDPAGELVADRCGLLSSIGPSD